MVAAASARPHAGCVRAALLTLMLCLSPCASAAAQTVVGDPVVVTEPAAELEDVSADELRDGETAEEDAPDDGPAPTGPKRGEIHVLGTDAVSSDSAPSPSPRATAPQAATSQAAATPRAAPARSAETLPFTGINAAHLAAIGCALLGSGLLLTRRLAG